MFSLESQLILLRMPAFEAKTSEMLPLFRRKNVLLCSTLAALMRVRKSLMRKEEK